MPLDFDKSIVVEKNGIQIARILVGTSPFIAAGQFEKSFEYYMEFVEKRGKIAEILAWCLSNGFSWIQAIDIDFIAWELSLASKKANVKPKIVLSTWDKPERAIKRFSSFDIKMVLAHASLVDTLNIDRLKKFLLQVESQGLIPGVVTHEPSRTLPEIKHIENIKAIMIPLNYAGLFNKNVDETLRHVRDMKAIVIAKKVLGAGRLPIDKALQWILSIPEVDSLALGIASISEAEQTLNLAYELACKRDKP